MPTEVRQIIFTSEELYDAVRVFRLRRRAPLPAAPLDRLALVADPEIRALVVFVADSSGQRPPPVEVGSDELATALILYCIDNKIPIPVAATKHIQMFGGSIGLVIHKNAQSTAQPHHVP